MSVKARLKEEYASEDVDGEDQPLQELCADFRRSTLLAPLFAA